MNYEKIYNQLILKRKNNILLKKQCYYESHHIIPRSINPELKNDKDNIVNLTAKQHYIAHHLLVKIYKNKKGEYINYYKMLKAFLFTIHIKNNCNFVSARVYQQLKKEISKTKTGKPSWNSGKHNVISEETRRKISQNHADVSGKNNGRYGSRSLYNPITKEKKIIKKEQINDYLNNGFILGYKIQKQKNCTTKGTK